MNIAEAIQNPDFRAGAAYAAHMMRHCVNAAHGQNGAVPAHLAPRPCCQGSVLVAVLGIAEAIEETVGIFNQDHAHGGVR